MITILSLNMIENVITNLNLNKTYDLTKCMLKLVYINKFVKLVKSYIKCRKIIGNIFYKDDSR